MLRKYTDEDICDEECKNVIDLFYDNYHEYNITYIMPKLNVYYIDINYNWNTIYEVVFYMNYNVAKNIFNISDNKYYNRFKSEVFELLRMKYYL